MYSVCRVCEICECTERVSRWTALPKSRTNTRYWRLARSHISHTRTQWLKLSKYGQLTLTHCVRRKCRFRFPETKYCSEPAARLVQSWHFAARLTHAARYRSSDPLEPAPPHQSYPPAIMRAHIHTRTPCSGRRTPKRARSSPTRASSWSQLSVPESARRLRLRHLREKYTLVTALSPAERCLPAVCVLLLAGSLVTARATLT